MEINQLKIYRSSAGSGKTRNLVFRYVSLLLLNPDHYRNILAVTFTNKATQEMKERIVALLVSLSTQGKEDDLKDLSEMTGLEAPTMKARAKLALQKILHDYSSFSISTIDSFFNGIIRAMAIELSLPLNYDIELRTESIIHELLRRLYGTLKDDKDLLSWLEGYIEYRLQEASSWDPDLPMKSIAQEIFKERFKVISPADMQKPATHIPDKLRQVREDFSSTCRALATEFMAKIKAYGLEYDSFLQKKSGVGAYFKRLAENTSTVSINFEFNSYVRDALENDKWFVASSREHEAFISSFLKPFGKKYLEFFEENHPDYVLAGTMFESFYLKGILSFLSKAFEDYKLEKNFIHISDNNKILRDIVSPDDAPFIFERSGNRYFHFLIDEFQDTSTMQWQNFRPLLHNSLASGNFSMIVGDAKQSIYRWRGGNMKLLNSTAEIDLKTFRKQIFTENLNTNYRSGPEIVNFNNRFFDVLVLEFLKDHVLHDPRSYVVAYSEESLQQKIWEKNTGMKSFVRIKKIDPSTKSTEEYNKLLRPDLIECINNYRVLNYEYSDMCVLVRTKEEGKRIAEILTEAGMDIITSDSLSISNSAIIGFIINCMKFIHNRSDLLAQTEIAYYYSLLQGTGKADPHEVFDCGTQENRHRRLPPAFLKMIAKLRKQNTYEIFEALIRIFSLQDHEDAFMAHLRDEVIEFSFGDSGNLADFLEYWENLMQFENETLDISAGKDAIRIMTIHKAKGLQFPVVLMPYCDSSILPKQGSALLWTDKEQQWDHAPGIWPVYYNKKLENTAFEGIIQTEQDETIVDNINLLYVAFTRAEKILNVWTKESKKSNSELKTFSHLIDRVLGEEFIDGVFTSGKAQRCEKKERKQEVPQAKETLIFPGSYPYSKLKKSTSTLEQSASQIYGNLLHHYMSMISQKSDFEKVENQIESNSEIKEEDRRKLLQEISNILSSPELISFFDGSATVLNEAEIILQDGKVIRPDRLMITNNECVILDYKTGAESSADQNVHKAQVLGYKNALEAMDYSNVQAYLLYVEEAKLLNASQ